MTHKQSLWAIKKICCICILCVSLFFVDTHNTKQTISYKCSSSITIDKVHKWENKCGAVSEHSHSSSTPSSDDDTPSSRSGKNIKTTCISDFFTRNLIKAVSTFVINFYFSVFNIKFTL